MEIDYQKGLVAASLMKQMVDAGEVEQDEDGSFYVPASGTSSKRYSNSLLLKQTDALELAVDVCLIVHRLNRHFRSLATVPRSTLIIIILIH